MALGEYNIENFDSLIHNYLEQKTDLGFEDTTPRGRAIISFQINHNRINILLRLYI